MNRGIVINLASGNDSLHFSPTSSLRIVAGGLVGFDYPEISVELASDASGKLSYERRSALCERRMSIRFELSDRSIFKEVRDCVNRMMLPGRVSSITTYFLGRRRMLEVIPLKAPEYIYESLSDTPEIVIHLTAPKPYFTEGIVYRSSVPTSRAVMTFPLSFIKGVGAVTSFAGVKNVAVIHNPGDTSCPVTLYLFAEDTVREPYVMLGDRKIRIDTELSAGDRVKIASTDGRYSVTVNGSSVSLYDRRNRAFSLSPGDNTVVLNAAYGAPNLRCYFEFEPRYLGM